jgi:hypothetical protein
MKGSLAVSEIDNYAKQRLADFIAVRLQALRDKAEPTAPQIEGPKSTDAAQPLLITLTAARKPTRRHNEAALPGRAHYPLVGLAFPN